MNSPLYSSPRNPETTSAFTTNTTSFSQYFLTLYLYFSISKVVRGMDKLSSCLKCRIQRHIFILKCPDLLPVKESQIVFPDRLIAMLCNQGYFLGKDNLEMVKCLVSDPTWSCLQGINTRNKKEHTHYFTLGVPLAEDNFPESRQCAQFISLSPSVLGFTGI